MKTRNMEHKKNTSRVLALVLAAALAAAAFTGCGGKKDDASSGGAQTQGDASSAGQTGTGADDASAGSDFDAASEIGVISREDGSGTRGAFIELFGIEEADASGEKIDNTTESAVITDSTSVMMTTVAGDPYAIGYISMGSMNDTVKALKIDGADATAENVANGSYKVSRPFNIVTKDGLSDAAKDFVDFILSADGQAVAEENGQIKASDAEAYAGSGASGKIVVAGSSSVTPLMEKLKEAYIAKNPDVSIEVQQSDSSTGIAYAIDGTCDIGMASRALKDTETGVTATVIAMDGIAVIVNNGNPAQDLTSAQVKDIFTGNATSWDAVISK